MSFAVPASFNVQEVSVSMWITETNPPCARTLLDGVNVMGTGETETFSTFWQSG